MRKIWNWIKDNPNRAILVRDLDKKLFSSKLEKHEQHTVGMLTLNLFLLYRLYIMVMGRSIEPPHNLQSKVHDKRSRSISSISDLGK